MPLSKNKVLLENQSLKMEALGNARELGGYKTQDGRTVKSGLLLRSAKPASANKKDLFRLQNDFHLAIITDLRMGYEKDLEPNPTLEGVKDVWCPIIDENLITPGSSGENIQKILNGNTVERLKKFLNSGMFSDQMYVQFISSRQGKIGYSQFFKQLLSLPEGKSLLFHCTQGKDRTGLAAMLILSALGVDEDTIMQDYLLTNESNAAIIEKERKLLIENNIPESDISIYLSIMDMVNPAFMQNAISYLKEKYGSVIAYIKEELSVSDSDIDALREKFLDFPVKPVQKA